MEEFAQESQISVKERALRLFTISMAVLVFIVTVVSALN
jgi:hypothetical protein